MSDGATPSTEVEPFSVDVTGAPSQTAGHTHPDRDFSPASPRLPISGPRGNGRLIESPKIPRAAKGLNNPKYARTAKRHKDPVDLRAATRLGKQRKTDEENILVLWDLFVPKSEKVGYKKHRLGMITRYATKWMATHRPTKTSRSISLERHYHAATEGSLAQPEGRVPQRQGQLVSPSEAALGFATYLDSNDPGLYDTIRRTSSRLQRHDALLPHGQNQGIQPT